MNFDMLTTKTIALGLLFVALAACGSTDPTPTPTPTQQLEARAKAAYSLALEEKWLEQAQYISPRAREVCDAAGYASRIGVFADLVIGLEGVSENPTFELIIRDVNAKGPEGTVLIGYLLDGEAAVVYDEGKRRWVLLDGQWWEEHEAWQDGCVGWKLFE